MSWKSIALNFAPSAAPFTLWVRHFLYGQTLRMTVWYYLDLKVKENLGRWHMITEVDGSPGEDGLQLFWWQVVKHLWACHVSHFDWIFYRIEASLRFSCTPGMYIILPNPHFFILQPKYIVRAQPSSLSEQFVAHTNSLIIQPSTSSYFKERWVLLFLCTSFCIWQLYLARSIQPSILLDPSVLGFAVIVGNV